MRETPTKRGRVNRYEKDKLKFSMTGQEKGDLLIQVTGYER
jgi:hypothetical protein